MSYYRESTCRGCGVTISGNQEHRGKLRQLYCSRECRYASRRRDLVLTGPDIERFLEKTARDGAHLIWEACRSSEGYGRFGIGRTTILASHAAWWIATGALPSPDLCVLHVCDIPECVEYRERGVYVLEGRTLPRRGHLFLGTRADNARDMAMKDRRKGLRTVWGERNGFSKLTEEGVLAIRERHRNGETQDAIARDYGVTQATISGVVLRKSWTHV